VLLDSKGKRVDATATYANRAVTLTGLDLKEGGHYRLAVLSTVRDVLGHNVAAEYSLDLVGPSAKKHGSNRPSVTAPPTPAAPSSASSSP